MNILRFGTRRPTAHFMSSTIKSVRGARWWTVTVFAIAMAWVEAAVVFYLRTLIHRIDPHQADPLPVIGTLGPTELVREAATLIMLLMVGILAGRTWRARLGYAAVAFGFWDIFYYVFLRVMCGWPRSVFDWDILFLIPLPWWGPVLAPVLIATLMIAWGTLASSEPLPGVPSGERRAWGLSLLGMALALYVFMADSLRTLSGGAEAVRHVLPVEFHWGLFLFALSLMAAPLVPMLRAWEQYRLTTGAERAGLEPRLKPGPL